MKARIFFTALLIAVFCTASLSYADGPQMINYQGYLTDDAGAPVTDTVGLTFRIYDDSTAGNLLWDESHAAVSVEQGIFNVLLGSVDSIAIAVFDGDTRYLEIAVDGRGPMTPRRQMVSVPYAFHCLFKDKDWCWSLDPDDMHPCDLNDDVGIGTASPEAPLHVKNLTLAAEETAVQVDFNSAVVQATARGIVAESDATGIKGARIGVYGKSTVDYSGNAGSAGGSLGYAWGYDYHGGVFGVSGLSQPSSFDNYDADATSYAAGGTFRVNPPAGISLDGTGTYYIGGVHATLDGEVNAAGYNAIVAGVIGEDNSTGSANSYAGHFTSYRTDSYDNTAVYARCYPQTGWGVGGDFSGGYVGLKASSDYFGVSAMVPNGQPGNCYGGYFQANGQSAASTPHGVCGVANSGPGALSYGIYGHASGEPDMCWAGYFNGNLHAGGTNVGSGTGGGLGVLRLSNALINPTTSLTNAALFYASGGEMFVYDAAGNATQISPHDKETGEWIFYSKNTKTGRVVRIDMERLVREVEKVTGEKFMTESWEDKN